MDSMEDKIESILNNPEMMNTIRNMAQALGNDRQEAPGKPDAPSPFPEIDLGMLQKLSGLARQGSIDSQQQNLLQALCPYLSRQRIQKLENAMRAAKMASIAASALGSSGAKLSTGR